GEVDAGEGLAEAAHLDEVEEGALLRGGVGVRRYAGHAAEARGDGLLPEEDGRRAPADLGVAHLVRGRAREHGEDDGLAPARGDLPRELREGADREVLLLVAGLPARADGEAVLRRELGRVERLPGDRAARAAERRGLLDLGAGEGADHDGSLT